MQDKEAGKAASRMADLDDTIEKLVAVAKKKGYIDSACTVASLKADAAKSKEKETQDDAVSLMTAMKKNLDSQTSSVRCPPSLPGAARQKRGTTPDKMQKNKHTEPMQQKSSNVNVSMAAHEQGEARHA